MFLYWLIFSFFFRYPQQESPKPEEQAAAQREASLRYERHREEAIRMNELAAHINSEADATPNMRPSPTRCGRFPSNALPTCGISTFGKSALRKRRL